MTRLTLENVNVSASSSFMLDEISATFKAGELVGIIGPNGAGKSTLAKAIVGLAAPSAGKILFEDIDLSAMRLRERATKIGYLPQLADFYWRMSIEEAVKLGRYGREHSEQAFNRVISDCELAQLLGRDVVALSGGEKMRVHLARLFYGYQDIIVADEPCASLDVAHQHRIMRLMREHSRNHTGIMIIHDLELAQRYCDRLLLLHRGRLMLDGTPNSVLQSAVCAKTFGVAFQSYTSDQQGNASRQLLVADPPEPQA